MRLNSESQALSVTTFASVMLAAAPGAFVDPVSVSTDVGDGRLPGDAAVWLHA
mgnify:CR=1 FL=1